MKNVLKCLLFLILTALPFAAQADTASRAQSALADLQEAILRGSVEDPSMLRLKISAEPLVANAAVWDSDGALIYPDKTGFNHVTFDLAEADLAAFERMRSSETIWAEALGHATLLYYCAAEQPICLLVSIPVLANTLGVTTKELSPTPTSREVPMFLWMLGAILLIGVALISWRVNTRKHGPVNATSLSLYPAQMRAQRGDLTVDLTPRDLSILTLLKDRVGEVVSKDDLYDAGWGREFMPNSRALDQHMLTLRRKLDPDKSRPELFETVRGAGYRLLS
jgi:hypothetical protein